MSPTRSPATFSLADSLDAGTGIKLPHISKGDESPETWDETTQDRQSVSPTPQPPVRSTLASINIVAACTSSLMITSALGSAVTISLPYVGEDLHIQKESLQWILSAYSISSVRGSSNDVSLSLADFAHRPASSSFLDDLRIFMDVNSSGLLDI